MVIAGFYRKRRSTLVTCVSSKWISLILPNTHFTNPLM